MSKEQSIRSYILDNFLFTDDQSALKSGESLLDRGLIDSTGVMELVAFLEEQYGVRITDEELLPENLDSVDRIVHFIEQKQRTAASV